jgi:hypothetical protein
MGTEHAGRTPCGTRRASRSPAGSPCWRKTGTSADKCLRLPTVNAGERRTHLRAIEAIMRSARDLARGVLTVSSSERTCQGAAVAGSRASRAVGGSHSRFVGEPLRGAPGCGPGRGFSSTHCMDGKVFGRVGGSGGRWGLADDERGQSLEGLAVLFLSDDQLRDAQRLRRARGASAHRQPQPESIPRL